jgi:hypothetical protein
MEGCLPTQAEGRRRSMGIAVTDKQDRLEEDHARIPYSRCAAEQWQRHLREHGLHHEEKGGGDEDSHREEHECGSVQRCGRRIL